MAKLLLLTSSTGGGHDLRANAFIAWAQRHEDGGPHEARLFRPLEASTALNRFGVHLYNTIQRRLPAAHHLYWSFLEVAGLHRHPWKISGAAPYIRELQTYQPDWVISVHAHLNHAYLALARQTLGHDKVRVGTYCGELSGGYGFSRHWVNPQADIFLAATDSCREAALRHGMAPDKAHQVGFMLRPASYESSADRASTLQTLGLAHDRFTLLLATGAVGANNHLPLLQALDAARKPIQVIALCGRDTALLDTLTRWTPQTPGLSLKAIPYSDQMPQLLASVDALAARGGTGTTSEAILAGCPLIVNALGGIMPQEIITRKYLARHGIDLRLKRPAQLPALLQPWLDQPNTLQAARTRMKQALPPGHPTDTLARLLTP